MKSNIALVGFMGTGKTAAGKLLAKRLNRQLIETDLIIESIAGKSIPDIFKDDGEIRFRELEIDAVKRVAGEEKAVIVCGGGVVLNTINIQRLRETSVIINLVASPEVILHRTSIDDAVRPLLKVDDPELRIKELMKFRKPFYEKAADFNINTSKLNITAVATKITTRLRKYEGFNF